MRQAGAHNTRLLTVMAHGTGSCGGSRQTSTHPMATTAPMTPRGTWITSYYGAFGPRGAFCIALRHKTLQAAETLHADEGFVAYAPFVQAGGAAERGAARRLAAQRRRGAQA